MTINITAPTKSQWYSVIRTAIFAALASFLATIQVVGLTHAGLVAGLSAAGTAVLKIVEKLFMTDPSEPVILEPNKLVGLVTPTQIPVSTPSPSPSPSPVVSPVEPTEPVEPTDPQPVI